MKILKQFKKLSFLIMLLFMISSVAQAQLSTVYLDITNGSDSYTGANITNSPAGSGPMATFGGALGAVDNNGTIVVLAGTYNGLDAAGANVVINTATYANLVADGSLTIELRELGGNKTIDLSGGAFEYDVDGGTLNITSTNGDEVMTTVAGVTFGATQENATVNLAAAANFSMATGQTLTMWGTSSFSNAAPTIGANFNLTYLGASSVTAGPEAAYGDFGTGVITVNKTNATDAITFGTAITDNGGITITKGTVSFTADVTVGGDVTVADAGDVSFTNLDMQAFDLTHNGTGDVAISGTLDLAVATGAAADGTLGSVENTSTGTISVTGATTWTGGDLTAASTFAAGAGTYAIDNQSTGSVTLGAVNLVTFDDADVDDFTFTAVNASTGTLGLGVITASESATNSYVGTLNVDAAAAAGTLNLAGGDILGTLSVGAGHTANISGATTVSGVLTNAGTVALGANTLTLDGSVAHATNSGTVTATTGGVAVTAAGASSFDGGTLSNVTKTGAGTCAFQTNAIDVTNLNVTAGTIAGNVATTASGTITVDGGTLAIGTISVTTDGFIQTSGTVTLLDNALSILDVNTDFTRTSGTFTAGAASIVEFTGAVAQNVAGGSLWTVGSLTFTNTADIVNLDQSVRVQNDVIISANTDLALDTKNIVLITAGATITNNGSYTATGGGGIIFGGIGIIAGQTAGSYATQTIGGTGTYSYITVAVGTGATVTTAASGENIKWNGVLTLENGDLTVAATDDFAPTGTSASVVRNAVAATGSDNGVVASAGTFNTNVPTDYDLTYNGTLAAARIISANASEFDANNIKTLTINTTAFKLILTSDADLTLKNNIVLAESSLFELRTVEPGIIVNSVAANVVTLAGAHAIAVGDWVTFVGLGNAADNKAYLVTASTTPVFTVAGTIADQGAPAGTAEVAAYNMTIPNALTVPKGAVVSGGDAAKNIILSGDAKAHSVTGTVSALSPIKVTGSGSSLNGNSDEATYQNTIADLLFEPAADGASFSSTDLEVIGNLTIQGTSVKTTATAAVTMNATAATIANIVVGNATATPAVTFTSNGTTSAQTGVLTLTNGTLSYTRNGAAPATSTVDGAVTLTKGTLTLGSNVSAATATSQVAGNLDLGGFTFTQLGGVNYVRTGAGTVTNGTVAFDATVGAITVTPGTTFVLPNVAFNGTVANAVTFGADAEIAGTVLFDNIATVTTAANVLTISGDAITVTNDAGAFTGAATFTGTATTMELAQNYAFPTMVVNSDGTLTVNSDDPGTNQFTLSVGTAFTLTKGIVDMNENDLTVATAFTRTAGSISQTDGYLNLNVGVPSLGTGFSIDNLNLDGVMSVAAATEKFTVVKNLVLDFNLTTDADGDLTLGDGATITRWTNGATLVKLPTFGATTNLNYKAVGGDLTTANEMPATVNDLTVVQSDATIVNTDGFEVVLAKNITVTGTLSLQDLLDATTTASVAITMADGSTLELKGLGTDMLKENLTRSGAMNLVYNGATATTTRELGATSGTPLAYAAYNGDITFKSTVALAANATFTGTLTFSGASDLTTTGQAVYVQGDAVQAAAATGFFAGTGTVSFTGATNTALTLVGDEVIPATMTFGLNKTNKDNTVTLSGGNLDFRVGTEGEGTFNNIVLTKGALVTGSSIVILEQDIASGIPTQGFTRTSGVIAGNVRKFVNNDANEAIAISRVDFPVGTPSGDYRPASYFFKTAPASSFDLTVNHAIVSPGGTNGLPLNTGTVEITNYPDFSWTATTGAGQTIAPSYKYDLQLQAQNYPDYATDGIQNMRMIRRAAGGTDNFWVLQGDDANYDNQTVATDWPLVKVIDATGGITSLGALFTYSQSNKPPVIAKTATVNSTVADVSADVVTISEDTDTLVVSYVVTDPDIGDAATTSAVVPTGATWDADAKTITWTPGLAQVGEYLAIITATDTYSQVTKDTLTITVVNTPSFAEAPADSVNVTEGITTTYQYTGGLEAGDPDSLTFTYTEIASGAIDADSVTIVDTTGVLSVSPVDGALGDIFTVIVTATDNTGGSVADTTVFTVVELSQAPVFAVEMADTNVDANSLLTLDFGPNASDPDGDTLTFTHTLLLDGVAVADSVGNGAMTAAGVYTWTPSFNQSGEYVLVANASDGVLSADDSVNVTVNFVNTPPVWVDEMPNSTVFLGDTLTFTYQATDANDDVVTYAFNGAYPPAATLDAATGEFSWKPATAAAFPVVIKVKATDGTDSVTTFAEVVVEVTTVNLSGVVTYNGGELLENVEVTLSDGQKDTTGADGAYLFTGLAAGDYTVTAAKADQVGGALASDALETQLYIVNIDSTFLATDMQKLAADVVGVGNITSNDALAILNRSVGIDDFQVADWLFESKTITVATTNKVQDLKGIAAGDARGDYSPAAGLAKTSNMAVNNGEVLNIKKQAEFELPISMAELTEVGSYTMKLQYAADKVEFLGATTSNGGMLVSNVKDNVISIAWMNLDSKVVKVKEGGALATLKFKATELFSKSDELSLELLAGSELTDRMAKNINAGISIPVVAIGIPDVFALRQNYPNPFNPSTTIQYDLPENGKVTLTIYNSLGQTVGTLVNQKQVAGAYDVNFNASNLASGVYLYRVTVEGTKNFVMTKKMILMK